jgi:hypothetical protein
MTKPKHRPIGQTIGGVLVGFDEQVWRHRPPADELVHHARPDDPVPAKDGSLLTIELPADVADAPGAPDTGPEAPAP